MGYRASAFFAVFGSGWPLLLLVVGRTHEFDCQREGGK